MRLNLYYSALIASIYCLLATTELCCAEEPIYKFLNSKGPNCEMVVKINYKYFEIEINIQEEFYIGRSEVFNTPSSNSRASLRIGRLSIGDLESLDFIYIMRVEMIGERIYVYIRSQLINGGLKDFRYHQLSEAIYCDSVFYEEGVAINISWRAKVEHSVNLSID